LFGTFFFLKLRRLCGNVENIVDRATDDNIKNAHCIMGT